MKLKSITTLVLLLISLCLWTGVSLAWLGAAQGGKQQVDRQSFNLGIVYAVRAMESVYQAKGKIGARDLPANLYFATVQSAAHTMARRDSMVFVAVKPDTSRDRKIEDGGE